MPKILKNDVAAKLRELILNGDIEAGTHLQEMQLSEELNVSRTPVRAAFNTLAAEGLLEPGPWGGYKVRLFTVAEVEEAYLLRAVLEGTACQRLAENGATEEDLRELRLILDEGDRLLGCKTSERSWLRAWLTMNNRFHRAIVSRSRIATLARLIDIVQSVPVVNPVFVGKYQFEPDFLATMDRAHEDHVRIVRAIEHRQSARSKALMEEHVTEAAERSVGWILSVTSGAENGLDGDDKPQPLDLRVLGVAPLARPAGEQ